MRAKIWMRKRETAYDEVDEALGAGDVSGYSIGYDGGRFVYFSKAGPMELERSIRVLSAAGLVR